MEPGTIALVSLAFTVVSSVATMQQQKSAAKRQEQLQRERIALEAQQRQLQEARAVASAKRTQRAKLAQLRSEAGNRGIIFSSGLEGAEQASVTNRPIVFCVQDFAEDTHSIGCK